ncbi:MAG: DUF5719 family protein [Actinomycetota bacterium]|nr:DUF5719 family protein [Actinomycetota bacterium]
MRVVRPKEALFVGLALALTAAGLGVDLQGRRSASAGPEARTSTGPRGQFIERSVFCPGAVERGRPDQKERERPDQKVGRLASRVLTVHAPRSRGVRIAARPWNRHPAPVDGKMVWLPGADRRAVDVVGAGGRVTAASLVGWQGPGDQGRRNALASGGAGASRCSPVASDRWYLPLGASSAGWDERITMFNPFPDEAVVRLDFAAEGRAPAVGPREVAVPARSSIQVKVNRVALPDPSLAATVTVRRGRVVVWKTVFRSPDRRLGRAPGRSPGTGPESRGALFSLGARTASTQWYFPEAGAGPGRSTTFAVMNPGAAPATVTISLLGRLAMVQPPSLVDVTVPAGGSKLIPVPAPAARSGLVRSFSAVVTSTSSSGVVAERSVSYGTGDLVGVASEMGATRAARRWSLAPAVARPAADDVVVLNPGSQDAVVDLTVFRPSSRGVTPARLRDLMVEAGARRTIPVGGLRVGPPGVVVVRSSAPVVAERRAYSPEFGDVASVMGEPLPLGDG